MLNGAIDIQFEGNDGTGHQSARQGEIYLKEISSRKFRHQRNLAQDSLR